MSNVLSEEKKQQVIALGRLGWSLRRIEKAAHIRRETAGAYFRAAGIAVRPPGGWGRNPAQLLYTPRECPLPTIRIMTIEEVQKLFGVLEVREQLIARLAVLAGMRPGEIFALKWGRLEAQHADIRQRIY